MSAVGKLGWRNGSGVGPDFAIGTIYDVLDVIERKPGVFMGEPSLTALYWILQGFQLATAAFSIDLARADPDFGEFHDFVAHHFQRTSSCAGWRNIILDESAGSEPAAFAKFYELLRQFRNHAATPGGPGSPAGAG